MLEDDVRSYLKKTRWRTFEKLYSRLKSRFPELTKKDIKRIVNTRVVHDVTNKTIKRNDKYLNKTFSNHTKAYFMDIFVNDLTGSLSETYYLIFINENTRYAVAYPITNKSVSSVLPKIKSFISEFKVASIISDAEKAFTSKEILKLLESKHIDYRVISDQRHTSLSIIDRFIRTIRDYGRKNKPFTNDKLQSFISEYNTSVHSSTNMTPTEMQNSKEKELQYIHNMIREQHDIESEPGYKLKKGDHVRLINKERGMHKVRFKATPSYYTIIEIDGTKITIQAADGTTKTVTRFQIIPIRNNNQYKYAKTVEGSNRGTISKIIRYYPKSKKYKVKFNVPGDSKGYIDTITERELRLGSQRPLKQTELEYEFFKNK
jgi:hypothetical protein